MHARSTAWGTALAALFTTFAALPAQRTHDIGSLGAKVTLRTNWEQRQFSDQLGPFQFIGTHRGLLRPPQTAYVVVREVLGSFACAEDYREVCDSMELRTEQAALTICEEADWRRVSRVAAVLADDYDGYYRSELLVFDGSALHLLVYGARSDRLGIDELAEQFLDGLAGPADDAAWQQQLAPVRAEVEFGDVVVSFERRPFVLRERQDKPAMLRAFGSVDKGLAVFVLEMSGQATAEQALASDRSVLQDGSPDYHEAGAEVLQIGGVEAVELRAEAQGFAYRDLMLRAGPERWLLLRLGSRGGLDVPRPDLDLVRQSLQVQRPDPGVDLPPLPAAVETGPRRSPEVAAMLAVGQVVAEVPAWLDGVARSADGSWAGWNWQGAHRLPATAGARLFPALERVTGLAHHGGQWYAVGNDRVVWREPDIRTEFTARRLFAAGRDLLCIDDAEPAWSGAHAQAGLRWTRHRADGSSTSGVLPVPAWSPMTVAADGARLLVVSQDVGRSGRSLLRCDLEHGGSQPLPGWQAVQHVAAARGGWLVTGCPVGQPHGIWSLPDDGAPRLLATDSNLLGERLDGELLTCRLQTMPAQLVTVSLDALGSRAIAPWAAAAAQLEAIGRRFRERLPRAPRRRDEVLAARATLQEVAHEVAAAELPTSGELVDAMLAQSLPVRFAVDGRIALMVLVAGAALDGGAEWIDSRSDDWAPWLVRCEVDGDHPFATARHLPSLLVSALDDSEADSAISHLLQRPEGPRLYCGVDAAALQAAVAATVPEGFVAAAQVVDAAALVAIAGGAPGNKELRRFVYARLAEAGRWQELRAFADACAAGAQAVADDDVARCLAWSRLLGEPAAEREAFAAALLAAVRRFPREARLYLLLAESFAARGADGRRAARTCCNRVLELSGAYGPESQRAQRLLEQLTK